MRHHRVYRQPVLGRSLDNRHVADAQQRHMQRTRNRGGAHGEHIHVLLDLLKLFFVRHAKPLLFVHHQKAQVMEVHIFGKQAVRSQHDVHFAR